MKTKKLWNQHLDDNVATRWVINQNKIQHGSSTQRGRKLYLAKVRLRLFAALSGEMQISCFLKGYIYSREHVQNVNHPIQRWLGRFELLFPTGGIFLWVGYICNKLAQKQIEINPWKTCIWWSRFTMEISTPSQVIGFYINVSFDWSKHRVELHCIALPRRLTKCAPSQLAVRLRYCLADALKESAPENTINTGQYRHSISIRNIHRRFLVTHLTNTPYESKQV